MMFHNPIPRKPLGQSTATSPEQSPLRFRSLRQPTTEKIGGGDEQQDQPNDLLFPILDELRKTRTIKYIDDAPIKSQFIWNTILQTVGVIAAICFGVFAILAYVAARDANNIAANANSLSSTANDQSLIANQLALLAFCNNAYIVDILGICSEVNAVAPQNIRSQASSLFGITAIPPSTTSTLTVTPVSTVVSLSTLTGPTTVGAETSTSSGASSAPTSASTSMTFAPTLSAAPTVGASSSSASPHTSVSTPVIVGIVVGILGCILAGLGAWLSYTTYKTRMKRSRAFRDESGGNFEENYLNPEGRPRDTRTGNYSQPQAPTRPTDDLGSYENVPTT